MQTSVSRPRKPPQVPQDPQVPPFLEDFMDEVWEPQKATAKRVPLYQTVKHPRIRIKRAIHTQRPPQLVASQPRPISVEKSYKPYTIAVSPKARVLVYSLVPLLPTPVKGCRPRHSSVEPKPAPRRSTELPPPLELQEIEPFPEFEDVAWTFGQRLDRAQKIVEHAKTQLRCD